MLLKNDFQVRCSIFTIHDLKLTLKINKIQVITCIHSKVTKKGNTVVIVSLQNDHDILSEEAGTKSLWTQDYKEIEKLDSK